MTIRVSYSALLSRRVTSLHRSLDVEKSLELAFDIPQGTGAIEGTVPASLERPEVFARGPVDVRLQPGQDGRFRIDGLPPGRYEVFASTSEDPGSPKGIALLVADGCTMSAGEVPGVP